MLEISKLLSDNEIIYIHMFRPNVDLQGKLYVNLTRYGNGTNFKVLILPLLLYFRSLHFYRALIYIYIIFQTYYDGKTMNDGKEIKVYICSISISSAILLSLPLYTRNSSRPQTAVHHL